MADNQPPGRNKPLQNNPGAHSVRRNLFGRDPDKPIDALAKEREDLSQRQENQFKKKWNFDVAADAPVEGKFEWTDCVPLNYPTPLLHVPTGEDPNASTSAKNQSSSNENSQPTQVRADSTSTRSLSSGDSIVSAAGSSSDDGTTSGSVQASSSSIYIPSVKRPRSSSDEPTENKLASRSPKR